MRNSTGIWSILENPFVYRLSQAILAPGAEEAVLAEVRQIMTGFGTPQSSPRSAAKAEVRNFLSPALHAKWNLDVGSGPKSLLWHLNIQPLGLDPIHAYNLCFQEKGRPAITGTATALPFLDNSLDHIWNFGLFHHLSNEEAERAVREMLRVVRPGGRVVVFDGVLPESAFRRPHMWLMRKLDRGRHMRSQAQFETLLSGREHWLVKRFQYCFWGHEGVLGVYQKPKNGT